MPTLGVLVIFNSGSYLELLPFQVKKIVLFIVFISTFILPLSILPFMRYKGLISTWNINNRQERIIPLFITGVFYSLAFYWLLKINVLPKFILQCMLACAISVFITLIISLFWKISIHMLGVGGLTGITIALLYMQGVNIHIYLMASILVAGFLGSARLKLNAHSPMQVYSGYLLGIITVILAVGFF